MRLMRLKLEKASMFEYWRNICRHSSSMQFTQCISCRWILITTRFARWEIWDFLKSLRAIDKEYVYFHSPLGKNHDNSFRPTCVLQLPDNIMVRYQMQPRIRADWNNRPSWETTFNKILQNPLANIHRHKLISIPTWINNYIHYNVRDKNSYPFPNVDGATVEVGECISNFTVPFTSHVTTYPCMDERDRCW